VFIVQIFRIMMLGYVLVLPVAAGALTPDEVLVVANKNAARSVGLAEYYMEKRGVPAGNLLQIWVTDQEHCSRAAFDRKIAGPVRRYLQKNQNRKRIRCLLLMYGVPMKAAGPGATEAEKALMQELRSRRDDLSAKLESGDETLNQEALKQELQEIRKQIRGEANTQNRSSAVDSELALVLAPEYPLGMWQRNPYCVGFQGRDLSLDKQDVLMVARLDGPDSDTVKRMIMDSLEAETNGLTGTAYFDARWPAPEKEKTSGYGFCDQSIHKAADWVKRSKRLEVVVEDTSALFQPGACPKAALYCGWYSLARYVDAFDWQPGAVGYHIASQECQTLRSRNSRVWCKRMLEEGVAATLGPIGEPYVQSFPVPEIFFAALLDGSYTLAEVYLLSNPFWSWKMVLVGDPLYRPFGG
jgi:uncharacterized protein (TIGR03790 family)